jgi:hypothetical protein
MIRLQLTGCSCGSVSKRRVLAAEPGLSDVEYLQARVHGSGWTVQAIYGKLGGVVKSVGPAKSQVMSRTIPGSAFQPGC